MMKPLLDMSMDEIVRRAHFCGMLQEANFRLARNTRVLRGRVTDLEHYISGLLERNQFLEQELERNKRTLEELIGGTSVQELTDDLERRIADLSKPRPIIEFENHAIANIAKRVLKREGILS